MGATILSLPSLSRSTSDGEANQPVWPGSILRVKTGARTGTAGMARLALAPAARGAAAADEVAAGAMAGESFAAATSPRAIALARVAELPEATDGDGVEPHAAEAKTSGRGSRSRSGRRCTRPWCPRSGRVSEGQR